MSKIPFEKIRSLVERKKLFEALLKEQQPEMLCKGDDDTLFHLRPTALLGDSALEGKMEAIEGHPKKDVEILGNFSVGTERFFIQTQLKVSANGASIPLNCDVYRLQRRASLRLSVNPAYDIYLSVTEAAGKPVYTIAQIADVSAGGARIFFSDVDSPIPASNSKALNLKVSDRFKGILHFGNKKTLELQCLVKHTQQAVHRGQVVEHYGIEFVDLTTTLRNRLLSLTMDLQKRMALDDL